LPGRIVLDVVDCALGGYGSGRVLLEVAESGSVRCAPTEEPIDLRVDQQTLAACYLGGNRLRQMSHGVQELTPGSLDRADLMFSVPLPPWNQTTF
jgi:sterol carrier protein